MDDNTAVNNNNTDESIEVRDNRGRFAKGASMGHTFKKGNKGRPKGLITKETVVTRVIAQKVLRLDPNKPGKYLSTKQYHVMLNRIAHKSSRIMLYFLEHAYGKVPDEVIQTPRLVMLSPLTPMPPLPGTDTKKIEGTDKSVTLRGTQAGDIIKTWKNLGREEPSDVAKDRGNKPGQGEPDTT